MKAFLEEIKWDSNGLIPVIAQDNETSEVLMMAYMNAESLQLTLEQKVAIYWSRSKQRLWKKGETSGHVQQVKAVHLDCDNDCLLLTVEQVGGIACHTGRKSCFYKVFKEDSWEEDAPVLKHPDDIY